MTEHDLMLPVGKSCGFGSAVPVLMIPCMSPAIFVHSEMPCMPTCMFGMPVLVSRLDLVVYRPSFGFDR